MYCIPGSKNEGMCLDDLPLTVEGDVGIVPVVAQLGQLGHQVGAVDKAHAVSQGSEILCTIPMLTCQHQVKSTSCCDICELD